METAILSRRLYASAMSEMNPNKLFNYYLQSMETEYNMAMINEVNALLGPYDTKLILYTYDSLLFDFNIKFTLFLYAILDTGDGNLDFLFRPIYLSGWVKTPIIS